MNNDKNDIIKDLITKSLAGETSAQEEKQLQDWIAQDPDHERDYHHFKKIFDLSNQHYSHRKRAIETGIDIDKEWNRFTNTLQANKTVSRTLQPDNHAGLWFYKVAAAILVLIASGVAINYFLSEKRDPVHFQSASTTLTVPLPDSSKVSLNRHSHISYAAGYGKDNRNVSLKGEAFFNVTPDGEKPFIIAVDHASIEVVGTSFNVSAYDSLDNIEVTVESGIVKLTSSKTKSEIKLTAGQKGVCYKLTGKLTTLANDNANFMAWKTHKIVFVENDLRSVVKTLNEIYHVHITVAPGIPESCVVTVTFDQQSLESVLRVLENTLNLTYKINGDQIEITSAGC